MIFDIDLVIVLDNIRLTSSAADLWLGVGPEIEASTKCMLGVKMII